MRRPKVLVTHRQVQPVALERLKRECDVILPDVDFPTRANILDLCPGIDGLLWTSYKMKLDHEILQAAGPKLKAVSLTMNGVDCVDLDELISRNIPLGHTPHIPNEAVADLAIGLMITASSAIFSSHDSDSHAGTCIQGSTVGIVGFGGIGELIAKRLQGFDVQTMLYCGHSVKENAKKFNAQFVAREELLRRSDYVFIACPLTPDSLRMFNRETFLIMKPTSVIINVARGAIVDEQALMDALKSGRIRAAALDTVTTEPIPADSELFHLPNCVIIPHLGTATKKTRDQMALRAVDNLIAGMRGETMPSQYFKPKTAN
ncbi:glyoxylate reductase/hydroxypyruvate reductase-like [Anopheles ziemanni]|uniref:glyoxylate reductase/hydroxypyruvate reductase-like n=1 Tax=Anopheles coustani TaxID=139045 RepID=UPI00265948B9|nr:glyoxylate reductase/hydroxypyruvate reductase-like [Anopheles coustani]XP_058177665.1 glyoxylate reductase/hydroxypyruvate reductase-like [Anopheles ziemanni]